MLELKDGFVLYHGSYNAQVLHCSNNKIKEIKGSFYNMTYLKCDNNQITELNIDKPCDEFEELYC